MVVITTVSQLSKRNYKVLTPAAVTIALSFIPWLLSLINVQLDTITVILFQTVVFTGAHLGFGYKYYDLYPWWDRVLHFLSGTAFFGFGVSFAKKVPEVGIAGTLLFSFTFSLALHSIWEVTEFLVDRISHSDHQRWQKNNPSVNHQPENAIQPPGLVDTMSDTIAEIIGALIACLGWWTFWSL